LSFPVSEEDCGKAETAQKAKAAANEVAATHKRLESIWEFSLLKLAINMGAWLAAQNPQGGPGRRMKNARAALAHPQDL
jgi:hypothetical protein